MAIATDLGNGMYDVRWPSGESYQVPEEAARQAAPASFPEDVNPDVVSAMGGQYGLPGSVDPYSDSNLADTMLGESEVESYPASEVNPYTPAGPEPDPHLYDRERGGGVPVDPELSIEGQMRAARMAGQQPAPGSSSSTSSSRSESGTRDYKPAPEAQRGRVPSLALENSMVAESTTDSIAAAERTKVAVAQSIEEQQALADERRAHVAETVARQQEMHEQSMERVQEHEANLQQAMANVSKMDMNKVFKDTPAHAMFGGIMAAGIAGWLNPTGKNSVVEQMIQMVDQSAKEQAANIATEKFAIQGQERALGRYIDSERDMEQRYLDGRTMLLSNVTAQMEMEKAKYQSAITIGNIDQSIAGFKKELAETFRESSKYKYESDFKERREKRAADEFNAQERRIKSHYNRSMKERASVRAASARANSAGPGKVDGKFIGYFDGRALYAGPAAGDVPDSELGKMRASVQVEQTLAMEMRKLQIVLKQVDGRAITPNDRAKVKAIQSNIVRATRPESGANTTGTEIDLLMEAIGNPTKLLRSPEVSRGLLRNAVEESAGRLNAKIDVFGGRWHDGKEAVEVPGQGVVYQDKWSPWNRADELSSALKPVDFAEAAKVSIDKQMQVVRGHAKEFSRAQAEGRMEDAEESRKQVMMSIQQTSDVIKRENISPSEVPAADAVRGEISSIMEGMGQPDFNGEVLGGIDSTLDEQRDRQDVRKNIKKWEKDNFTNSAVRAMSAASSGDAPFTEEEYDWYLRNK